MIDKIAICCKTTRSAVWTAYNHMLYRYSVLDHILFISTFVHLCFAYGVKQWISFLLFFSIFYDCRQSLLTYERFYISLSLECVESCMESSKILYVTHLLLLDKKDGVLDSVLCLMKMQLLFEFNVIKEIAKCIVKVRHSLSIFAYLFLQVLCCAIVQAMMFKYQCVNTKRKVFHFFIFFSFLRRSVLAIQLGHLVLLLLILLQDNKKLNRLYRPFLSHRDYGERVYSHILLLGSVLYTAISLQADGEYHLVLTSICFLDSFASIAGKCVGHKKKSLIGLLCGFFAGNTAYFLMYHSFFRWKYFMLASLIEYFLRCNDNITLPFFLVFFLRHAHSTG